MKLSFYKTYFELEKTHWLLRGKRMLITDQLFHFSHKKPSDTTLLDYGCASGLFVYELDKKGFQTYGLDMSQEAVEFGKEQGVKNLQIIDPDSHRIDFPDTFFDVIFVLDVLEHLENEDWAMKEMWRVLKPGGIVISTVPAYMWMWTFHDDLAHHYRRYTLTNFEEMVRKSGPWEILRSSYFNTLLFPIIAVVRIFTKAFGLHSRESDFDLNNELINKICFVIFSFERWMLKYVNLPFGVSVLTVFKKIK